MSALDTLTPTFDLAEFDLYLKALLSPIVGKPASEQTLIACRLFLNYFLTSSTVYLWRCLAVGGKTRDFLPILDHKEAKKAYLEFKQDKATSEEGNVTLRDYLHVNTSYESYTYNLTAFNSAYHLQYAYLPGAWSKQH